MALFEARTDPASTTRADDEKALNERIQTALRDVPSLDDDRIIRRLANVTGAVLRTNYYQREADGTPKPVLSFKLESGRLEELPAPRPWREIFVYAPEVEGVHLRFGPIARGRHPLVRPARGLPHRDPRPGQGAAGEERRPLCRSAPRAVSFPRRCRPIRHAMCSWRRAPPPTRLSSAPCSTSPTIWRRTARSFPPPMCCGWMATILSGGRGRQGHRHLLRYRQRHRGRSRLLAGRRLRQRRQPCYDHKKMGITARAALGGNQAAFPRTGHGYPGRGFHGRRRGRHVGAMCSATACCCRGTSASSPPSIIAMSFSIPMPMRRTGFAERERLFNLPRSSGTITTKDLIGRAAVSSRAASRKFHFRRRCRRCSAPTRRACRRRAYPRAAGRPGRPALVRRHRHLHQGIDAEPCRGRRPRQ